MRRIQHLSIPASGGPGWGLLLLWLALAGCSNKRVVTVPRPAAPRICFETQRVSVDLSSYPDVQKLNPVPDGIIRVYTPQGGEPVLIPNVPPVLGSARIEKNNLIFEPRYPFQPGVPYVVFLDTDIFPLGTSKYWEVFEFPRPRRPETQIVAVFPSGNRLPENLLRFYVHFSAPMSRGEAYERIRLLDSAGKPVAAPFLELNEELWDPSGTRFTLLFDPGRIKRGLKPREEVGPVLEEGKSYTLVIDRSWTDAAGSPLKEEFRKSFTVGPPEEARLDPVAWKLTPPAAGTNGPLTVRFPRPLDHALLHRMLTVRDAAGKSLVGTVQVRDEEGVWTFTPKSVWDAGDYSLVADTALEDLAGNSVRHPFEVDVLRPVERATKAETVQIPFRIK